MHGLRWAGPNVHMFINLKGCYRATSVHRAACLRCGLGTACSTGPCRPGPAHHWAGPCLGWAKIPCFGPGRHAEGCMAIYTTVTDILLGFRTDTVHISC